MRKAWEDKWKADSQSAGAFFIFVVFLRENDIQADSQLGGRSLFLFHSFWENDMEADSQMGGRVFYFSCKRNKSRQPVGGHFWFRSFYII